MKLKLIKKTLGEMHGLQKRSASFRGKEPRVNNVLVDETHLVAPGDLKGHTAARYAEGLFAHVFHRLSADRDP